MPVRSSPNAEGACGLAPAPLQCRRVRVDCLTWVRVAGEVDLLGAPQLEQALRVAPDDFPLLVMVDMREVTFMDASGAHVLADATDAVTREGGRLVVIRGPVLFDWWFALLDLDERVEVVGLRADGCRIPVPTSLGS